MSRSSSLVLALAASGCLGSVDGNGTPPDDRGGAPSPSDPSSKADPAMPPGLAAAQGPAGAAACKNPQARGLANNSMRRLTRPQIVNTLKDLLGSSIVGDPLLQTALDTIPLDTIKTDPGDINPDPSDALAGALFSAGARAADLALASKAELFGACARQTPVTDACATEFIGKFGLRVYRRPLASTEVSALMGTYARAGSGLGGLSAVLARLLQAPSMVFLIEEGGASSGGRTRLTDYEVASRLSYLLADTTPDAALLEAARKGELGQLANVTVHVQRLLSTATAKAKMRDFFGFYTQTGLMPDPYPAAAKLAGIDSKNLATEMRQELGDYVEYQIFTRPGSFRDLMTSDAVFPRSANLAKLLDTTISSGAQPAHATLAHAGLVLRPALLASQNARTPAMHRGAVVRKQLLCDGLPPPPPEAANAAAAAASNKTVGNRAKLEDLTSNGGALCMGCHRLINPLGFALEGYDQLGRPRTNETSYDAKDQPSTIFPIDTSVKDPQIEEGGPKSLSGAGDLVSALAGSAKARACIALTAFQFYRWRGAADADACALADLQAGTADGASLAQMFVANVANEDIFWKGY